MIFLDTNIGIYFGKRSSVVLENHLEEANKLGMELVISVITLHELELGVHRSHNPVTKRTRVDTFLQLISNVVPFEAEDALVAATVRSSLMAEGCSIGSHDLLIAAQVIRRGGILVTHNVSEFSRVPGLRWEDWTQA